MLKLTPEARKLLGEQGYDPSYGARPLKRVIQKNVQDALARIVLSGKLQDGSTVEIQVKDGNIVLKGDNF